jgi:hypothetical protein
LKWLTHPDRIRDIGYADTELQVGIRQAELSLNWMNSQPPQLAQATDLAADELAQFEFRAAVLSKNTLGSTWILHDEIPIINERLIDWVVGTLHRRNLRTLWRVGVERRYQPKRGKHFRDGDTDIEFEGVRFIGHNTSFTPMGEWNPAEDIDFSEL